ncbi:MAG: hypothetical protein JEY96_16895 [Bacteroidales bacterium]|nr:hypothetical protein [Bacteroidales bacterium]
MNDEWKDVKVKLGDQVIETTNLVYTTAEFEKQFPFDSDEIKKIYDQLAEINHKMNVDHSKYLIAVCKFSLEKAIDITEGLRQFRLKFGTTISKRYSI